MSDTPPVGQPFTMKPDGQIRTNWQTIGSIILGTAIIVGGLFSVKADIAAAAKDAGDAKSMVRDIKDDLYRLRVQLNQFDGFSASANQPKKANP
jgi:hypothetical protein